MQENFEAGYATYQRLIDSAKTPRQEAELHLKRGYAMYKICSEECTEMIAEDAWAAERGSPSADSALLLYRLGVAYGEDGGSDQWLAVSESRGQPSSWWNLGIWDNQAGAKNGSN